MGLAAGLYLVRRMVEGPRRARKYNLQRGVLPVAVAVRRRSVARPLGPRARWAHAAAYVESKGVTLAPGSRKLRGWRSIERGEPRWRRWCPVEHGGEELVALPRGSSWLRDAPESGGGWSVLFSPRPGEQTRWVGGSGWWYGDLSSASPPEPASGDFPRLESRDHERALPVSWASRLERVENLSVPRVARFLTGRHVARCL